MTGTEALERIQAGIVEVRHAVANAATDKRVTAGIKKLSPREVLEAMLVRQGIDVDHPPPGKRAEWVRCKDCGIPIRNTKTGTRRSLCEPCRTPFKSCSKCGADLPVRERGRQTNKTGLCLPCARRGVGPMICAKSTPEERSARSRKGGEATSAKRKADPAALREDMLRLSRMVDPAKRANAMREALRSMPEEKRKARTKAANRARHPHRAPKPPATPPRP